MQQTDGERRRPEASALRGFFQEQWDYLLFLVRGNDARDPSLAEFNRALESLVDGTDARIRMVLNYRKQLRQGVRTILEHVERVVAQLPQARAADRHAFSRDPLINAVFSSPQDLQRTLSESTTVQDFVRKSLAPGQVQCYSVLMATPREKRILGMELSGDMLLRDVAQTALNFAERHLDHPGHDEQEVRLSLERRLFESIVQALRQEVSAARQQGSAEGPQAYLKRLNEVLIQPQRLLRMEQRNLRVSKRGVVVAGASDEPSNEIDLNELVLAGTPRRLLLLVQYPVSELLNREQLYSETLRALGPLEPNG